MFLYIMNYLQSGLESALIVIVLDVKAFAEVRGGRVNRGDLRCRLYGPKVYIEKMRELVNSLRTAGLL